MNYFFFLDNDDKSLNQSVEIFNRPPAIRLCLDNLKPKKIIAFYSDGKKWNYHFIKNINPNENAIIKKNDLPLNFLDKSVFLCIKDHADFDNFNLKDEDYMNCTPSWRANIKIFSKTSSVSYQGEYPHSMTQKKITLVSCSPMIQNKSNISSYFYLINLKNNPAKKLFKVKILNIKKEIIKEIIFETNTINFCKLNNILASHDELTYIFTSEEEGGVPIYFSRNSNNTSFSLEHTHPPTEYTYAGNRFFFQKKKQLHLKTFL